MSEIVGLPRVLDQIRDLGRAAIFYAVTEQDGSTPTKWSEGEVLYLTHVGDTEGEVTVAANETYNDLTAPELAADAPLKSYRMGNAPILTVPMVYADPAKRALMSSTGSASDGYDRPQPVEERTFVVFPEELFYNATAGAKGHNLTLNWSTGAFTLTDPSAQAVPLTGRKLELLGTSLWLWRTHVRIPQTRFRIDEGGKSIESVEIRVMIDAEKPNGHLLYTVGNPFTADIFIDGAES